MAVDEFGNFRGRQSQPSGANVGGLIGSVREQGAALGAAGQALQQAGTIWAAIEAKAQAEKAQRLMKQADIDAHIVRQEYAEAISQSEMAATPERWPQLAQELIDKRIEALEQSDARAGAKDDLRFFWTKQKVLLAGTAKEGAAKRQIEMNQSASLELGSVRMKEGDFAGAAVAMADLPEPVRAKALADGRFASLDGAVLATDAIASLEQMRADVTARDAGGSFTHYPELDESKRNTLTRRINERENQVQTAQNRNSQNVVRDMRQGVVFDEAELRARAEANDASSIHPADVDFMLRLQAEIYDKRKGSGQDGQKVSADPIAQSLKSEVAARLLQRWDSKDGEYINLAADTSEYQEVLNRVGSASISTDDKAALYDLIVRTRESSLSNMKMPRPFWFNRDLSEPETDFMDGYYRSMGGLIGLSPETSGFGDLFMEQETELFKWLRENPQATDEQRQKKMTDVTGAARKRIGESLDARKNLWGL